jgi:hypothetical protein
MTFIVTLSVSDKLTGVGEVYDVVLTYKNGLLAEVDGF